MRINCGRNGLAQSSIIIHSKKNMKTTDYERNYKISICQANGSLTRLKNLRQKITADKNLSERKRHSLLILVEERIDILLEGFFNRRPEVCGIDR